MTPPLHRRHDETNPAATPPTAATTRASGLYPVETSQPAPSALFPTPSCPRPLKGGGAAHYVDSKGLVVAFDPQDEWDATMTAISLSDLQRQIATRERELEALRQELESRRGHLTELTRRKEELQRQLRQVEEEITALAEAPPTQRAQSRPVTPATPAPTASRGDQPRLGELIVSLLREAGGPRTARQLTEEAQRRGYQPTSNKPIKVVESRLQDLKSQGVVRRASGQPGYILMPAADGAGKQKSKPRPPARTKSTKAAPKPVKPAAAARKSSRKGSASPGTARTAPAGNRGGQPPLREVLTHILKNSRKLLTGSELAERAQAAGYQSRSEKFVDSVWSLLGQMANVEHVRGQGYRLKET